MRALGLIALVACGGGGGSAIDAARDTPSADADKAASCASSFGTGLPAGFGRIDGTILAVVPPGDEACAAPNSTHLVLQVTTQEGVFRMVVDVLSNQGSPDVLFHELDGALAGDEWGDGWHAAQQLDYVDTLAVHSTDFEAMPETMLVDKITSELDLGARVSVFATVGSDEPDSAHLVHRNLPNADGAIVTHADTSSSHYLLMSFDEQTF